MPVKAEPGVEIAISEETLYIYPGSKYCHMRVRSFIILCLLTGILNACKKSEPASTDSVIFSFNDSLKATGKMEFRPGYDYIGGPNCEFEFDRLGQYATGETIDIGLFAGYHCGLITDPLPVTTNLFTVVINENPYPWETISYSYVKDLAPNDQGNTPGDLTLTITERKSNHVKGTITGTIYRTNVGQNLISSKFDCQFDLAIPFVQ
jgi:hypothetical protein